METAWGKDFVKKEFKDDLGPTFDKLSKDMDALNKKLIGVEKELAKISSQKAKLIKDYEQATSTLTKYGMKIKIKSSKEKTDHGKQWDGIEKILTSEFSKDWGNGYYSTHRRVAKQVNELEPDYPGQPS
ncbi:hypothetical protein FPZ52_11775 (plasmid) [Qingshengfaniella alkalisoli]|uniref:Uncharacterized protein n=2 Tax=Qingshengfaniella alkalisoli TaxID=2599296 RepID=A0A5B8I997_9RHOB|nr:hypothetical protein FPZ52_11775 [Qingshengfaniella alkalisoli]